MGLSRLDSFTKTDLKAVGLSNSHFVDACAVTSLSRFIQYKLKRSSSAQGRGYSHDAPTIKRWCAIESSPLPGALATSFKSLS